MERETFGLFEQAKDTFHHTTGKKRQAEAHRLRRRKGGVNRGQVGEGKKDRYPKLIQENEDGLVKSLSLDTSSPFRKMLRLSSAGSQRLLHPGLD